MMKSIVAAVDGSLECAAILDHAATWANRLDAELRGVFVEDERDFVTFPTYSESEGAVPKPVPLPPAELQAAKQRVRQEGDALHRQFEKIAAKRKARGSWHVERGIVNKILIAEARSADMTVIGSHGLRVAPELHRVGPTAEDVIHAALRPVLVVPEDSKPGGPILVAFDGGPAVHRAIVAGAELAVAMKVPIIVLTVRDNREEGEAIQAPLGRYLGAYGVKTDFRVEPGEHHSEDVILKMARETKAGMILMGAFSQSPIKEFFFGSVTRTVLASMPCPVLMMT